MKVECCAWCKTRRWAECLFLSDKVLCESTEEALALWAGDVSGGRCLYRLGPVLVDRRSTGNFAERLFDRLCVVVALDCTSLRWGSLRSG